MSRMTIAYNVLMLEPGVICTIIGALCLVLVLFGLFGVLHHPLLGHLDKDESHRLEQERYIVA